MEIDKFFHDGWKSILQTNLRSCRHYNKDVFTCSKLFSRTNFTKSANPKTPSPTLRLIKMNKNLSELFSWVNLDPMNKLNKENISRVISREIKWLLNFLKDQTKIMSQSKTSPFISLSTNISTHILLLNKIILALKLKFMSGKWF